MSRQSTSATENLRTDLARERGLSEENMKHPTVWEITRRNQKGTCTTSQIGTAPVNGEEQNTKSKTPILQHEFYIPVAKRSIDLVVSTCSRRQKARAHLQDRREATESLHIRVLFHLYPSIVRFCVWSTGSESRVRQRSREGTQ